MSPDLNVIKNLILPASIQQAFKKGRVDDVYRKIYELADELAVHEMKRYAEKTLVTERGTKEKALDVVRDTYEYRNERLQLHIENMFRLLEISSKVDKVDEVQAKK